MLLTETSTLASYNQWYPNVGDLVVNNTNSNVYGRIVKVLPIYPGVVLPEDGQPPVVFARAKNMYSRRNPTFKIVVQWLNSKEEEKLTLLHATEVSSFISQVKAAEESYSKIMQAFGKLTELPAVGEDVLDKYTVDMKTHGCY